VQADKEDGTESTGAVAGTPPARNSTRDTQRKKAVSDQINLHGLVGIPGDSAIVKSKFFTRFNVLKGHVDYKYALCKKVREWKAIKKARLA